MGAIKIKVGDVAEIKTPVGLAYVQYTHGTEDFGELVRVLPGLLASRPTNFAELAKQRELYFIFYSLRYALRAGQAVIVSNQPVPDWAREVPLMRHPAGAAPGGSTVTWRFVPALSSLTVDFLKRTPVVRELTPEQRKLSIHVLRPHPAMVAELARGWTPERAEELENEDRARAAARRAKRQDNAKSSRPDESVRHYLYFREKSNAEKASKWFSSQGYSVEMRLGADGENWLTMVKHAPPKDPNGMNELHDEIKAVASQLGGEYDGWETAL